MITLYDSSCEENKYSFHFRWGEDQIMDLIEKSIKNGEYSVFGYIPDLHLNVLQKENSNWYFDHYGTMVTVSYPVYRCSLRR